MWSIVKLSITSIWSYRSRAILTMLGVIIGIGSVVMFMSLGEGLRQAINKEVRSLGTNILIVLGGQFGQGQQLGPNNFLGDILKIEDVEEIKTLDGVNQVAPLMLVGGSIKNQDKASLGAFLTASTPNYNQVFKDLKIERGRSFSDQDNDQAAQVIVLGPKIVQDLFGTDDPLGRKVKIAPHELEVIGITQTPESPSIIGGIDYSTMAIMPLQTGKAIKGNINVFRIIMTLNDNIDPEKYTTTIEDVLLKRHAKEDFSVLTQKDLLSFMDTILKLLTSATVAIASISLIVAGVGIMNIMLVSVTERTKEIGLRKAVGATTTDILWQFLIEAVVLSLLGAAIAVGLSLGASWVIGKYSPLDPVVTGDSIVLAASVGIVVGLIFGIAPAYRAAKMDPIKALKWE